MDRIKNIVLSKSRNIIGYTLIYIIFIYIARWRLTFNFDGLLILAGAVVGIFILDIAEDVVRTNPSPFRSVLFYAAFLPVCLFIVSSSNSAAAAGLVLALHITMIANIRKDLATDGQINKYFTYLKVDLTPQNQKNLIVLFALFLAVETLIFVR